MAAAPGTISRRTGARLTWTLLISVLGALPLSGCGAPSTRAHRDGPGEARAFGGADPKDPISTDRPSFGVAPGVVSDGRIQVETGYAIARDSNANTQTLPNLGVRVGLGSGVEARLFTPGGIAAEGGEDGFADVLLGARFKLLEQDRWMPALALQPSISVPVGDASGTDSWQPELVVPMQWNLNPKSALIANLVAQLGTQDATRETEVNLAASILLSRTLNDRWAVFGEWFGVLPGGRQDQQNVDAGVTWLWSDDLQLDAAVGMGLSGAATDFQFTVGAAYRF